MKFHVSRTFNQPSIKLGGRDPAAISVSFGSDKDDLKATDVLAAAIRDKMPKGLPAQIQRTREQAKETLRASQLAEAELDQLLAKRRITELSGEDGMAASLRSIDQQIVEARQRVADAQVDAGNLSGASAAVTETFLGAEQEKVMTAVRQALDQRLEAAVAVLGAVASEQLTEILRAARARTLLGHPAVAAGFFDAVIRETV